MVIKTDCVIVGAGPVGLFQVFELGLLDIKAHVIDSLSQPGGQCSELYPEKPIYDIPALPVCGAQELIDRLMEQIKPFGAEFHFKQTVTSIIKNEDSTFNVVTDAGTEFITKTVIIAAGLGAFEPRRLRKPGAAECENHSLFYKVKQASDFENKNIMIFGGGDSALDWALELADKANSLSLIHRREEFRAAPASVLKARELEKDGMLTIHIGSIKSIDYEEHSISAVTIETNDKNQVRIEGDTAIIFYGLKPSPGPILEWGLDLGPKKKILVDTEKFQTSVEGIFAIGDVNFYPGKKELILSGFHEAALAAFAVQKHLNPDAKQFLQYTTTSPIMHERLGLDED